MCGEIEMEVGWGYPEALSAGSLGTNAGGTRVLETSFELGFACQRSNPNDNEWCLCRSVSSQSSGCCKGEFAISGPPSQAIETKNFDVLSPSVPSLGALQGRHSDNLELEYLHIFAYGSSWIRWLTAGCESSNMSIPLAVTASFTTPCTLFKRQNTPSQDPEGV